MSKRVNGEGTIATKARPDGLWTARYTVVVDGVTKRPVLYGRTRSEVAQKLREALTSRDRGEANPPARQTVGDYLTTWHEGTRSHLRSSSWAREGEHVRLQLIPTLGKISLRRLAPTDVERAYATLLARGLAPGTVRRCHAVLHRALGQAVRWQMLSRNVAGMVDPPRVAHTEMQALSPAQALRLVEATHGQRDEALFVLAVSTGMRQGEILALRWDDVDLAERYVSVTGSLGRGGDGRLAIAETKTSSSRRRIELTAGTVAVLQRHRAQQLEARLAAANVWTDLGLVFPNGLGGFLAKGKLNDRFHALLEVTGLPRIRFHDLRHTAASLMLGRGVHPKVAAEMLGHSSIAITLDLYSHVTPAMQREAVDALEELLFT